MRNRRLTSTRGGLDWRRVSQSVSVRQTDDSPSRVERRFDPAEEEGGEGPPCEPCLLEGLRVHSRVTSHDCSTKTVVLNQNSISVLSMYAKRAKCATRGEDVCC
jgi:hypothetical protein